MISLKRILSAGLFLLLLVTSACGETVSPVCFHCREKPATETYISTNALGSTKQIDICKDCAGDVELLVFLNGGRMEPFQESAEHDLPEMPWNLAAVCYDMSRAEAAIGNNGNVITGTWDYGDGTYYVEFECKEIYGAVPAQSVFWSMKEYYSLDFVFDEKETDAFLPGSLFLRFKDELTRQYGDPVEYNGTFLEWGNENCTLSLYYAYDGNLDLSYEIPK